MLSRSRSPRIRYKDYEVLRSSFHDDQSSNMAGVVPACYAIDCACFFALAIIILIYRYVLSPFRRGFYCDDQTIDKPFKESTVPTVMALAVGQTVALLIYIVVELYERKRRQNSLRLLDGSVQDDSCAEGIKGSLWSRVPDTLKRILVVYVAFLYGCLVTAVLTDIGKYAVGRLRPHFFSVCQPNWNEFNCTDTRGFARYVTDYKCLGKTSLVREARLSFPSGHSSNALFTVMFLTLFIESHLHLPKPSQFFKVLLQIGTLTLGILCSLSRISDFKHHWSDVLGGMIIGTLVAFWIVCRNLRWRFGQVAEVIPNSKKPMLEGKALHGNGETVDDL